MAKPQPKPATKPAPKPATKPEGQPAKAAPEPRGPVRLQEHYQKTIVPSLMKEFSYTNRMQVPRLECIVLNVRSEERRVGKECRSRWGRGEWKKNKGPSARHYARCRHARRKTEYGSDLC